HFKGSMQVMTKTFSRKRPLMALAVLALMTSAAPLAAQRSGDAEARLKKVEAEVTALQRQVFPGGDGKYFAPEISRGTSAAAPVGTPATTPVTDLLTRMDSVESQMTRLTAQSEENGNRIAQIEAKFAAMSAPPSASAPAPVSALLSAPVVVPTAVVKPAPATATVPKPAITSANLAPAPAKPIAESSGPTAKRVAAVKAVEKPVSDDAGDDEYSYGYRLWEAEFYPEAEQQLQLFITKYPKHKRISFGRNLLGRALLDDGKPKEAAQWFLKNYQADKKGDRAPDSLIYLAESMRQLKDVKRSCIALGEFADGYPAEASGRLKSIYDQVRFGVKCN
ncbi:MAG: hypothetical protein ABIW31_04865, partial [Novosphingobium sp.]